MFWLVVAVGLGVLSPSLDDVASKHSVSMSPQGAPAFQAMMNIGHVFNQFDSDSSAMVVLEGQDKLGDDAHQYYNQIVAKLTAQGLTVDGGPPERQWAIFSCSPTWSWRIAGRRRLDLPGWLRVRWAVSRG